MTIPTNTPFPSRSPWIVNKVNKLCNDPTIENSAKLPYYKEWAQTYDQDLDSCGYPGAEFIAERAFRAYEDIHGVDRELRLLDVGCGTGYAGLRVAAEAERLGIKLHMVGLDYSKDMLEKAAPKGIYDELIEADFYKPLPVARESFDIVIIAGVFIPGHVGPSIMRNIVTVMKRDAVACVSIRHEMYLQDKKTFLAEFSRLNLTIVDNEKHAYVMDHPANFVSLRRN